jgi:hypothetical protein
MRNEKIEELTAEDAIRSILSRAAATTVAEASPMPAGKRWTMGNTRPGRGVGGDGGILENRRRLWWRRRRR